MNNVRLNRGDIMWRPKEGWVNPYLQQDESGDFVNSRVFEFGADAMYEAIVKFLKVEVGKLTILRGGSYGLSPASTERIRQTQLDEFKKSLLDLMGE